ncbi:putative zinc finger protein [Orchesella cincta]|uniref:Putative zinc finger protein n=1 Tax=Orchesella cincta TaxID=48709 RepID=A0A1D2MI50_ORCCI|nr:putative zinc finger protein [Orchesella cincta]
MEAMSRGKDLTSKGRQEGQQRRIFRCTECPYQSVYKCSVQVHMRYMHGAEKRPKAIKKFKCPECPKRFPNLSRMKQHFSLRHKGEMPYSCVFCEKKFGFRSSFYRHLQAHIREFYYSCTICDYSSTSNESLKSHIRHIHEGLTEEERRKTLKVCPVCKKLVSGLNHHLRKHTGERPHHCGKCGKSYKDSSNLKDHQLIVHEGQKPHCCEVCKAKFGRVGDLKEHLRYVHGPEKKPFVKRMHNCVFCDKNITSGSRYSHYRRHIKEYSYSCPNCDKSYASAGELKRHVDIHHYFKVPVKKLVECNICNKSLFSKQSLAKHMCGHTAGKPIFLCNLLLSLLFLERCGLDVHMRRVHGTEKHPKSVLKIKCSECEKWFSCRGRLRVHFRRHTGERPYSCLFCESRFLDTRSFNRHLRSHIREFYNHCKICGNSFNGRSDLKAHVKRKHFILAALATAKDCDRKRRQSVNTDSGNVGGVHETTNNNVNPLGGLGDALKGLPPSANGKAPVIEIASVNTIVGEGAPTGGKSECKDKDDDK